MGSLPNLHELEQLERKRELREARREERRAREANRLHRTKASYNPYLMAGLGMGGIGTLGMAVAATGGGGGGGAGSAAAATAATTALSGFAMGGSALVGLGPPGLLAKHYHQHQHHRHSLTTRHRVLRTRSSGAAHSIWEDQMMEHLAAYSPISTRSHRINPVSSYHVQAALAASRRRESVNSSIGATSIRRLITLNSRNCRQKVPSHVRQKVWKSFTFLIIAHGLMCAFLLPVLGLQGSNSIWHHREQWLHVGPNIGSLLLSLAFLITAGMCLLTIRLIRKFGYTHLMVANYLAMSVFLLCHLYPSIYTLLPAYILLGITLSPSWVSKIALIVHFGSKLSCSQHECMLATSHALDPLDEHKIFCNRDQKVRRLARWFQAAQDLGLIFGALIAAIVLACTSTDWNCFDFNSSTTTQIVKSAPTLNLSEQLPTPSALKSITYGIPSLWPAAPGYLDEFYVHNELGIRICGADMCPVWQVDVDEENVSTFTTNDTIFTHFISGKSRAGGITLISIYFLLSVGSVVLSVFVGKIAATFRHERNKGITDTLLFAGPMAYFIGTEQAYMLGDFLRAFVSCSLGISMVAGALVGMGLMQSIVSCTLSMLLRHTKRIVVILAGFFFHSCLLLALSSWKPSSDDSALFYVLAASWGACNAMWETLLLALITLNHTNHVAEVTAPLQGLRFLGLGVTFAAHGFMCETPKIIILVIILVVSVPPYAMLEIRFEAQRKAYLINL